VYGALFGLFTYATYDLTNYGTLKSWTAGLAAADILWGWYGNDGRCIDARNAGRSAR
jgi:uncharacterized membrane protein